jgi:1,4-dihydroxy-2-naphthoyl-CoA hydrolase
VIVPWHSTDNDVATLNALGEGCIHALVGIEFLEISESGLSARMPVDARTKQPHGLLHGGASVVLAESVASVAGMLTVDPETNVVVGMEINANHIRPVTQGYVYAVATPESLGHRTQVWSVRITDESDRLVCISRVTLAVLAKDRAA